MPAEKALLALHHWRMQAALPSSRGLQSIMGKIHKNIFLELSILKRQEMRSQQMLWSA